MKGDSADKMNSFVVFPQLCTGIFPSKAFNRVEGQKFQKFNMRMTHGYLPEI